MSAGFWLNVGQIINDQMTNNACLGKFYTDGIKNSVETKRNDVKYGYQFWVYNVNGVPTLTMTGHGGFFNVVNTTNNTILTMFSVDENYKYGNLFSKGTISKIASEIN